MSSVQRGAKTLKGAFVSVEASKMQVIPFQFNPANIKRTVTSQLVGGEENDRSLAVRFKAAPQQKIDAEVEFDASSALDHGDSNAQEHGVYAQLAALELLMAPSSSVVQKMQSKLASGVMEVIPMTAPRVYFVWGESRVLPVRLEEYSITEENFDSALNPIQVSVAVSMRVLTYSDLDSSNQAYQQYLAYQQSMETLAPQACGSLAQTGAKQSNVT